MLHELHGSPPPVERSADFSAVRYAQCWEDADVLLEALDVRPGDVCLSIASAGDNTLALLTRDPAKVIALDLSPAQLACLELRVSAYRELEYAELLELMGSRPSERRGELYRQCRSRMSDAGRVFWDARPQEVEAGIGAAGKFERYFSLFRRYAIPLIHSRPKVEELLSGGPPETREAFYRNRWDTWRWRLLFRAFFSRFVMGRLGRDPSFFRYVQGSVADRILARSRYALTELDPSQNPYLHWILTGTHGCALPLALRPENFDAIRSNLDRLEWRRASLGDFLTSCPPRSVGRFNLSDVFEYMPLDEYHRLLDRLCAAGRRGGRLAYWNMLAPRRRPESHADRLRPLDDLARRLHAQDKAFFYSDFIVEEVLA